MSVKEEKAEGVHTIEALTASSVALASSKAFSMLSQLMTSFPSDSLSKDTNKDWCEQKCEQKFSIHAILFT